MKNRHRCHECMYRCLKCTDVRDVRYVVQWTDGCINVNGVKMLVMCRCQERTNARNAHMVCYEYTDVRNIYSRFWKVYMPGMYRCQGMCRCQEYTDARDVQRPRMYRRQGCTNAGDVQMKRDLQMPGMYICCDAQMPGMYRCQGMYMYARDVQMPGMYR